MCDFDDDSDLDVPMYSEAACLTIDPLPYRRHPHTLSDQFYNAGKSHQCWWCLSTINKGDRYRGYSCTFTGLDSISNFRFCIGCCEALVAGLWDGFDTWHIRCKIKFRTHPMPFNGDVRI